MPVKVNLLQSIRTQDNPYCRVGELLTVNKKKITECLQERTATKKKRTDELIRVSESRTSKKGMKETPSRRIIHSYVVFK
jgi:hypothetical protein